MLLWVHTYTSSNGVKQSINVFTSRNGCRFNDAAYGGVTDKCDVTNHIYNIRFPCVTTRHAGSWHIESPLDTPPHSQRISVVVLGEFHFTPKSYEVNLVQVEKQKAGHVQHETIRLLLFAFGKISLCNDKGTFFRPTSPSSNKSFACACGATVHKRRRKRFSLSMVV